MPSGDLTFSGGLGLVRSDAALPLIGDGDDGDEGGGTGGGDVLAATGIPTVDVASGARTTIVRSIRDVGTSTLAAVPWQKKGGGVLVLPHNSTFSEQQFTFDGQLDVPYYNTVATPLGTANTAGGDDTASVAVKYGASGDPFNGSTVRFFRSDASEDNDTPVEAAPQKTRLVRENRETLIVAGLGVAGSDGRRMGSLNVGPGLTLTQTRSGSTEGGELKIWHLKASEYDRQTSMGSPGEIDALIRIDADSTYNIDNIAVLYQTTSASDIGFSPGAYASGDNTHDVNAVFAGGGVVNVANVKPTYGSTALRMTMYVADGTTVTTPGIIPTSSAAPASKRAYGFMGDAPELRDGDPTTYTPGVLQITSASTSAFASGIYIYRVSNMQSANGIIETTFGTGEAIVDGPITYVTGSAAGPSITKRGPGGLAVSEVNLGSGGLGGGGALVVEAGSFRANRIQASGLDIQTNSTVHIPTSSSFSSSIVDDLQIAGTGKLDLQPATGFIWDYPGTTIAASPATSVRSMIIANQIGITSPPTSFVIGYGEALDIRMGGATFLGTAPTDGTGVLIRSTYGGDSNLDGIVDFNDLATLAQHYNLPIAEWEKGDFTYDGVINFNDLVVLAQDYNLGVLAARGGSTEDGAYQVYVELQADAPWILEDALSHPEGQALFGPYLDGGSDGPGFAHKPQVIVAFLCSGANANGLFVQAAEGHHRNSVHQKSRPA